MSNSIVNLQILKSFQVFGMVSKAPSTTQVDWYPLFCGWIKCNTDGAAMGCSGHVAAGGLFCDSAGAILGCFSSYLGISNALFAEFSAAIFAVEVAYDKGWHYL